jgi:hypothetical protein
MTRLTRVFGSPIFIDRESKNMKKVIWFEITKTWKVATEDACADPDCNGMPCAILDTDTVPDGAETEVVRLGEMVAGLDEGEDDEDPPPPTTPLGNFARGEEWGAGYNAGYAAAKEVVLEAWKEEGDPE